MNLKLQEKEDACKMYIEEECKKLEAEFASKVELQPSPSQKEDGDVPTSITTKVSTTPTPLSHIPILCPHSNPTKFCATNHPNQGLYQSYHPSLLFCS